MLNPNVRNLILAFVFCNAGLVLADGSAKAPAPLRSRNIEVIRKLIEEGVIIKNSDGKYEIKGEYIDLDQLEDQLFDAGQTVTSA